MSCVLIAIIIAVQIIVVSYFMAVTTGRGDDKYFSLLILLTVPTIYRYVDLSVVRYISACLSTNHSTCSITFLTFFTLYDKL